MEGYKINTSVIYALFVFTLMIIIKSDSTWKEILPYLLLLALAYIFILLVTTLLVLAFLKILMDLNEIIYDFYNPFEDLLEGMFFI